MLTPLTRIIQEMQAAPNLEVALSSVVSHVCQMLQAETVSLFISDDDRGEYVLLASEGVQSALTARVGIKFGLGLVGLVGQREEPINVDNAAEHPNYYRHPKVDDEGLPAFLGVPIINKGNLLGVLAVRQKAANVFPEEDVAFCMTLAVQLASEIAKARSRGEIAKLKKRRRKKKESVLDGVSGSSGVAIGTAVVVFPPADLDAVPEKKAGNVEAETESFEKGLALAREEINQIQQRAKKTLSNSENAIFDAYLRILDSRSLINDVINEIKAGMWAQLALKHVIKKRILQFEQLEDPYLRERASDLRDLGRRILSHMQAVDREQLTYPKNTILVSDEVTATALMEVSEGHLAGVISGTGSSNSHVAILARALGLPTVMGVSGIPMQELAKHECVVDGYNGVVYLSPAQALKKEFEALATEEKQLDDDLEALRDLPAETKDGHAVGLFVNTGLAVEGGLSLSAGAEGVGLYRTELPFMIRDRFPSEEEQRIMYRQLLSTFAPRKVVMRTLDIGGDKALPYFYVKEDNPFLGWRGIRVTLDHPEIFLQQVRAMLKANEGLNNLSILLPMITSVSEVEESLRLINQAYEELLEEGLKIEKPPIGLMVEVPAAVYQARDLARRVDFLSVGTNDLIQYLLAVDRNNPQVAHLYDGLHPAVLAALKHVVKSGHKAGKKVTICGELAGDPLALVLLLGMGYDTLSMNARSIPRMKWVIRQFTYKKAKALLDEVLKMDDPKEIRLHVSAALEECGLGGLIRAGR